jgi:hypothetical protein
MNKKKLGVGLIVVAVIAFGISLALFAAYLNASNTFSSPDMQLRMLTLSYAEIDKMRSMLNMALYLAVASFFVAVASAGTGIYMRVTTVSSQNEP